MSDWDLPLTAAEARELTGRVQALVEGYRRPQQPGDEHFVAQVQFFPRRSR